MVKPIPSRQLRNQQTISLREEALSTSEASPLQAEPVEREEGAASGMSDNSSRHASGGSEPTTTTETEDQANPVSNSINESSHNGGGGDASVSSTSDLDGPQCHLRARQQSTEMGASAEAPPASGQGDENVRENVDSGASRSSCSYLLDCTDHLTQDYPPPPGVDPQIAAFNRDMFLQPLQDAIQGSNVYQPPCLNQWQTTSHNQHYYHNLDTTLQVRRRFSEVMNVFAVSDQRELVREKAATVNIESLDFDSFTDLLFGLFQEGGVTSERLVVLFFFLFDLIIRSLQEHLINSFHCLLHWSQLYIVGTFSLWIEENGGWEVVLDQSINHVYTGAKIAFLCVGIVALCIYIRNSR